MVDGISSQRLTDRETALKVMSNTVQSCYTLYGSTLNWGGFRNATVISLGGCACRERHRVEPFWAHQKCCCSRSCKALRYCAKNFQNVYCMHLLLLICCLCAASSFQDHQRSLQGEQGSYATAWKAVTSKPPLYLWTGRYHHVEPLGELVWEALSCRCAQACMAAPASGYEIAGRCPMVGYGDWSPKSITMSKRFYCNDRACLWVAMQVIWYVDQHLSLTDYYRNRCSRPNSCNSPAPGQPLLHHRSPILWTFTATSNQVHQYLNTKQAKVKIFCGPRISCNTLRLSCKKVHRSQYAGDLCNLLHDFHESSSASSPALYDCTLHIGGSLGWL